LTRRIIKREKNAQKMTQREQKKFAIIFRFLPPTRRLNISLFCCGFFYFNVCVFVPSSIVGSG